MVVSCTVIRLHPASGAVVDEAIYLVNPSGGNRREIQRSGVRRREDRTGLAASGWGYEPGRGIERCGDSARQALKLQTARHRGCASALLHSVCTSRRPYSDPLSSNQGCNDIGESELTGSR